MAFQSVPDCIEAVSLFSCNGQTVQIGFHAQLPGGYGLADVELVADRVDAAVGTHFLPIMSVDVSYVRTEAKGLENINDFQVERSAGAGSGLEGSEALPLNVTFAIKKSSGLTGRSARGRLYWPVVATNQLDSNENFITTAAADGFVAAVQQVRAQLDALPFNAVIVSRYTNGALRATGVPFEWASTSYTDLTVDTQRRRLP